jgi:hypothetical protein
VVGHSGRVPLGLGRGAVAERSQASQAPQQRDDAVHVDPSTVKASGVLMGEGLKAPGRLVNGFGADGVLERHSLEGSPSIPIGIL